MRWHWRIQQFGEPATAAPSRNFFLFFLSRNGKKGVVLPRIDFENIFWPWSPPHPINHHPLTDFLDQLLRMLTSSSLLLEILKESSQLSWITDHDYFSVLFEEELCRLNFIFRVKSIEVKVLELSIWIDRNMNWSSIIDLLIILLRFVFRLDIKKSTCL